MVIKNTKAKVIKLYIYFRERKRSNSISNINSKKKFFFVLKFER